MHPLLIAPGGETAIPVHLIRSSEWEAWSAERPAHVRALAATFSFKAAKGSVVLITQSDGHVERVLYGVGDGSDVSVLASLPGQLPAGSYQIASAPAGFAAPLIAQFWTEGGYRFDRYKRVDRGLARLVLPEGADAGIVSSIAGACDFIRDLVNTPAGDLGPVALEAEARRLAAAHGASCTVTVGEDLLSGNYPLVHAVGRAAHEAPRFIELAWGREGAAKLALVGKGVTYDTGGLNLKPGGSMALMKKDMGGAAHALGLARMVMEAGLDVDLRVYVPAVENAIGAGAFRPGDILPSRKGTTVEIDNTDAEGRLVLADALTRAEEWHPDLLIDFATLTGAARVALGPDLPPFYTDDETLAGQLVSAAQAAADPIWRMPLWPAYLSYLNSNIADIKNSSDTSFAGSITAALFLKQFVSTPAWVHFDVFAWRPARDGRTAQGAAQAVRAVFRVLRLRYGGANTTTT
jgi:leucyl aminopeptidase